jgi:hypothetical protein
VNLELIRKLESGHGSSKKARKHAVGHGTGTGDGNVLNVRKAVRFTSRGDGPAALARKSAPGTDRQKRKGRR